MSVSPAITVVVCTRDRAPRLARLLASLRAQTLDSQRFEVVVVDDGSRDDTPALLQRQLASDALKLRVLDGRQAGIAEARNVGWHAAAAPIVAFTDDDCEVSPVWLSEGLRACERWPDAIIQGRTLPMPGELERRGIFSRTQEVQRLGPFFQTCNIFYPIWVLEQLGGFAREFRRAGEDTDLAWRALERRICARFAPTALAWHAVEDLGPIGHLRLTLRWSDAVANLARHPKLARELLVHRVFWKRSHALLFQAVLGALLALRLKPAALLACPYLLHALTRCRAVGASPALVTYVLVHDLLESYAAIRGGARHGVVVI